LLLDSATKIAAVFNFLAILELLQLQKISLLLGEGFNNFWIVNADEVAV
jgi:segregation and condensation protein A